MEKRIGHLESRIGQLEGRMEIVEKKITDRFTTWRMFFFSGITSKPAAHEYNISRRNFTDKYNVASN